VEHAPVGRADRDHDDGARARVRFGRDADRIKAKRLLRVLTVLPIITRRS